jgi:hypothetical protein
LASALPAGEPGSGTLRSVIDLDALAGIWFAVTISSALFLLLLARRAPSAD